MVGCSGNASPVAPSPTPQPAPPAAIALTCPASIALRTTTGQPVPLQYAPPEAVGGTAPLLVQCTPAPGAAVPVGVTTVSCMVTDARSQTASCTFAVAVTVAPSLTVQRFLALGDSLTFGTTSRAPLRVIPGDTYVQKLEFLLTERYPDQRLTVTNAGVPGNWVEMIEARYPEALRQSQAQVLILQGGANDLNAEGARAIRPAIGGLERMTRDAQRRGVSVILSTITPQRPGSPKGTASQEVREMNAQIRDLCRRYQTGCADLYAALGNEQSPLIGADGLHPTPAGYDAIAEAYLDVIRRLFERAPAPAPPSP